MRNVICSTIVVLVLASSAFAQPARRAAVVEDESDRPRIDVEAYTVDITIVPEESKLDGVAEVRFRQLDRQDFATFDLDRRLRVLKVSVGGEEIRFRQFDLDSTLEIDLGGLQFSSGSPTVKIEYSGILDSEDSEEARRDPVLARISGETAVTRPGYVLPS